jgi:hypothetical protein
VRSESHDATRPVSRRSFRAKRPSGCRYHDQREEMPSPSCSASVALRPQQRPLAFHQQASR